MRHPLLVRAAAASLAASLSVAGAQTQGQAPQSLQDPIEAAAVTAPSPFLRSGDTGPRGFASLVFERGTYDVLSELHASATLVRLDGFPLPGGMDVSLLLRPVEVMEPGATATVIGADGERSALAPSVRLFSGSVPGRASRVFLGVSEEMAHGYVSLDGETFVLSSGATADGTAAITHGDVFAGTDAEAFCQALGDARDAEEGPDSPLSIGKFQVAQTRVFLELDNQYRSLFASDQAAIDYAVLLTAATNEIYRRDLAVTLTIPNGFIQLWNQTPPWGVVTTFDDIGKFSSWWKSGANPNRSVSRAIAHLLTNRSSAVWRRRSAASATPSLATPSRACTAASPTRSSTPAAATGTCSSSRTRTDTSTARATRSTTCRRSGVTTARGPTRARS